MIIGADEGLMNCMIRRGRDIVLAQARFQGPVRDMIVDDRARVADR